MTNNQSNQNTDASNETIAQVKGVQGRVLVSDSEGHARTVRADHNLVLGDSVKAHGSSVAILDFGKAGLVTLGHDQVITLDAELLTLLNQINESDSVGDAVNFDFLQKAIEGGENLEELLPATAAGEGNTQPSDGTSSGGTSRFEFTANEVTPESGFNTSGPSASSAESNTDFGSDVDLDFILRANNDAPTTDGINAISVDEDVTIALDMSAAFQDSDEGQSLNYQVEGLPEGLSFDPITGEISGTPTNDDALANEGTYTVTITATDDSGADNNSVTTSFQLQVVNINDAPTVDSSISLGSMRGISCQITRHFSSTI